MQNSPDLCKYPDCDGEVNEYGFCEDHTVKRKSLGKSISQVQDALKLKASMADPTATHVQQVFDGIEV